MNKTPCHKNSEKIVQNDLLEQDQVYNRRQDHKRCKSVDQIPINNRPRFLSEDKKRKVVKNYFIQKQEVHPDGEFQDCNTKLYESEDAEQKESFPEDSISASESSESSVEVQAGDQQNQQFDVDANAIEIQENIIFKLIPKQELIKLHSETQIMNNACGDKLRVIQNIKITYQTKY